MKRCFDLTGAYVLLFLTAIPMLCIALAIRFSTDGPVFFCQWRRGHRGIPFRIWKFRTMTIAEQDCSLSELVRDSRDSRITAVGRILRRTHLDELPQLWNVIRGDMSLVGPRPMSISIADEYLRRFPWSAQRFLVKPGLTGPVQVSGRQSLQDDPEYCHHLDKEYAEIESQWQRLSHDMRILWNTVFVVLSGQGV